MKPALFLVLTLSASLRAQNDPTANDPVNEVRIALRFGPDHVLIVGGAIPAATLPVAFPRAPGDSPLQPGEDVFEVSSEYMAGIHAVPETHWKPWDEWTVYTGAGAPIPVVIESLAVTCYCGGLGGYATALARIETSASARAIEGLQAGAYLAAPPGWSAKVSQTPLLPALLSPEIDRLMREKAGKTVGANSKYNGTLLSWSVPGRKPLYFAETIWSDAAGKPVYGGTGVIEGSNVLDFSSDIGELMKQPEMQGRPPEPGAFLNAWVIGTRRFVLTNFNGYEGFGVMLKELVPGKGLVPTALAFGAGC